MGEEACYIQSKVYWRSSCGDSRGKEIGGGRKWCVLGMGKVGVSGHRERFVCHT